MQTIIARLQEGASTPYEISNCSPAASALLLARLLQTGGRSLCCLLPSDEDMQLLAQDFAFFSQAPVIQFPDLGIPPYTVLKPDSAALSARVSALSRLQELETPALILCPITAALRRLPKPERLRKRSELVIAGDTCDREAFIASAVSCGYHRCELVRQPGDIAVRGGIIDIYPPAWTGENPGPLRLDFFGDKVESMRTFDPFTQRSTGEINELILLPASEFLFPCGQTEKERMLAAFDALFEYAPKEAGARKYRELLNQGQPFAGLDIFAPILAGGPEEQQSFFACLPESCRLLLADFPACSRAWSLFYEDLRENFEASQEQGGLAPAPQDLFLPEQELTTLLRTKIFARLSRLPDPDLGQETLSLPARNHALLAQEMALSRQKQGMLGPFAAHIREWQERGEICLLACRSERQASHVQGILTERQVEARLATQFCIQETSPAQGTVLCLPQPLSQGFDLTEEGLHILSIAELFGEKRLAPGKRKKAGACDAPPVCLDELHEGDVVVHSDYGIALFQGLVNLELAGVRGDFLLLLFRGDDKLYVPTDKLHKVSKYQGLNDTEPRLDVLGSQKWAYTKQKVSGAVWAVAQELLDIYAKRAMRQGRRFSPPGEFYRELEESFPYDETSGQLKAIDDVIDDLCREQPMDRLICGDVGYGKTEVAARAAFKVIEDGFQAAILAPTTVLAEQHAATFRERFASFPIRIACLNRFRSRNEQKQITNDLAEGKIDLVIGTHRLLSKDVSYSKLGLLVVDEEHRFGVVHKEKIKKIKATVDVLTLTATPIPRTLQMSLLGIRDLSVISTPPKQRKPVKTVLAKRDPLIIKEACQRELARGGQVFFLHNRVQSIMQVAASIAALAPQARVGVAHGQMPALELENIIGRFIRHELDILVCTSIIESGLDIVNANTILIDRADCFGLADLYQLRGRVGRGDRQGYAYLLVAALDHLTADAESRLQALLAHSDLGDGFQVAMNDLQIRGGGNLLGVSQSGHIAAVGYDLYLQLLQETVADLRAAQEGDEKKAEEEAFEAEVKLAQDAFFPESYIKDTGLRYQAYRRLSYAGKNGPDELQAIYEELCDRFGPPPKAAQNLFALISLKQRLKKLRITKLEQGKDFIFFSFDASTPVDPQRIFRFARERNARKKGADKQSKAALCRVTPEGRLIVPLEGGNPFQESDEILSCFEQAPDGPQASE